MYAIGGRDGDEVHSSVECLCIDGRPSASKIKWRRVGPLTQARCHFGSVAFMGEVIVVGGVGPGDAPIKSIEMFARKRFNGDGLWQGAVEPRFIQGRIEGLVSSYNGLMFFCKQVFFIYFCILTNANVQ